MIQRLLILIISTLLLCQSFPTSTKLGHPTCIPSPNFSTGRQTCLKYYHISEIVTESSFQSREAFCRLYAANQAMPRTAEQRLFLNNLQMESSLNVKIVFVGAYGDSRIGQNQDYRWSDGGIIIDGWLNVTHTVLDNDTNLDCVALVFGEDGEIGLSRSQCVKNNTFLSCELCLPENELLLNHCSSICVFADGNVTCTSDLKHCDNDSILFERPVIDSLDNVYRTSDFCSLSPCPSDRYGPHCGFQCFCKDGEPCHIKSGQCPTDMCKLGWFGEACNNTRCSLPQFYGENCEKRCYCANEQSCDQETGICHIGCSENASGRDCQQIKPISTENNCPTGKCGAECQTVCNCKNDARCKNETCFCQDGCQEGWVGSHCSRTDCPLGTWGDMCENLCACDGDQIACNVFNGHCPLDCALGWSGSSCNVSCANQGFWGSNCDRKCLCKNAGPCNMHTGQCPEVDFVKLFSKQCQNPLLWGAECSKPCENEHCAVCDRNSKGIKCLRCKPGYKFNGGFCDIECDLFKYGDNCSENCSANCAGDGLCDRVNGTCLEGCISGVDDGNKCVETCPEYTYGISCAFNCSRGCGGQGECHPITGHCNEGCKEGFLTRRCIEPKNGTVLKVSPFVDQGPSLQKQYNPPSLVAVLCALALMVFIILCLGFVSSFLKGPERVDVSRVDAHDYQVFRYQNERHPSKTDRANKELVNAWQKSITGLTLL